MGEQFDERREQAPWLVGDRKPYPVVDVAVQERMAAGDQFDRHGAKRPGIIARRIKVTQDWIAGNRKKQGGGGDKQPGLRGKAKQPKKRLNCDGNHPEIGRKGEGNTSCGSWAQGPLGSCREANR